MYYLLVVHVFFRKGTSLGGLRIMLRYGIKNKKNRFWLQKCPFKLPNDPVYPSVCRLVSFPCSYRSTYFARVENKKYRAVLEHPVTVAYFQERSP